MASEEIPLGKPDTFQTPVKTTGAIPVLSQNADQMTDITECSICFDTFTDPKVLPCIHTFCLKCLEKYGENCTLPEAEMSCPLCRRTFVLPPGGFLDLPNNFFINKLLMIGRLNGPQTNPIFCELCLDEGGASTKAASFCFECSQHMCKACDKRHKRTKCSMSHRIVSLEDAQPSTTLMKMTVSYCCKHSDEHIKFYCYDCKTTSCVVCYVAEHNRHQCTDIKDAADEFFKGLNEDIEKVNICFKQNQLLIKQLEASKNDFTNSVAETERAVMKNCDELRAIVDSHQAQLKEELDLILKKGLKGYDCRHDEIVRHSISLESYTRYCEQVKDKGTAGDIARTADDLHARAAELIDNQVVQNKEKLDARKVQFIPSPMISVKNVIGTIVSTESILSSFVNKSIVHHAFEPSGLIYGITRFGSRLYIVRQGPNEFDVAVFNALDYSPIQCVVIPDIESIWSFAACQRHQCLYIGDAGTGIVHRVNTLDTTVTKIDLVKDDEPSGLSVNRNSNLLVTVAHEAKVLEFTTHGSFVRRIDLGVNIKDPSCVVELPNNCFLAIQDCVPEHRLCIVDAAGNLLHYFIDNSVSSLDPYACRLTVDSHGYVLVADHHNSRIRLFSPILIHIGDVAIPDCQVDQPLSLHLDEKSGKLYIAEEGFDGCDEETPLEPCYSNESDQQTDDVGTEDTEFFDADEPDVMACVAYHVKFAHGYADEVCVKVIQRGIEENLYHTEFKYDFLEEVDENLAQSSDDGEDLKGPYGVDGKVCENDARDIDVVLNDQQADQLQNEGAEPHGEKSCGRRRHGRVVVLKLSDF